MNLYAIIILLFILAGAGTSVWGWRMLRKSREALSWPVVEGNIEVSQPHSQEDEFLPQIEFSYRVAGTDYRKRLQFPTGTTPTEEFARSYSDRFPAGKSVTVYHHPNDPENATIDPAPQGDWLVLAIGLASIAFGILFLFVS